MPAFSAIRTAPVRDRRQRSASSDGEISTCLVLPCCLLIALFLMRDIHLMSSNRIVTDGQQQEEVFGGAEKVGSGGGGRQAMPSRLVSTQRRAGAMGYAEGRTRYRQDGVLATEWPAGCCFYRRCLGTREARLMSVPASPTALRGGRNCLSTNECLMWPPKPSWDKALCESDHSRSTVRWLRRRPRGQRRAKRDGNLGGPLLAL